MEFESMPGQEGTLLYIGVDEGTTAPVDSILCILGDKGEDYKDLLSSSNGVEEEEGRSSEAAPTPATGS